MVAISEVNNHIILSWDLLIFSRANFGVIHPILFWWDIDYSRDNEGNSVIMSLPPPPPNSIYLPTICKVLIIQKMENIRI